MIIEFNQYFQGYNVSIGAFIENPEVNPREYFIKIKVNGKSFGNIDRTTVPVGAVIRLLVLIFRYIYRIR